MLTHVVSLFSFATAIFGYSFCTASKKGFFLILRNALRISAVSVVSNLVLFVGKVFITVAAALSGESFLAEEHLILLSV